MSSPFGVLPIICGMKDFSSKLWTMVSASSALGIYMYSRSRTLLIARTTRYRHFFTVDLCVPITLPMTRYSAQLASFYKPTATCFSKLNGSLGCKTCSLGSNLPRSCSQSSIKLRLYIGNFQAIQLGHSEHLRFGSENRYFFPSPKLIFGTEYIP